MSIRVFEAFAGIGAQAEALKELGLDYKVVGISEVDKDAIRAYEAIHGPVKNYGDIRSITALPDCDLLTYSHPCTSLSICGKQEGMVEGTNTASSLVWEVGRLLKTANHLPDVLVMENVDAIMNSRNIVEFRRWVQTLEALGYTTSYRIVNAKDYGVPQYRKRCFAISLRGGKKYIFPEKQPSTLRLRDLMEQNVSDDFYLSYDKVVNYAPVDVPNLNGLIKTGDLNKYRFEYMNRVYSPDGISPTVNTVQGGGRAIKVYLGRNEDGLAIVRYLTPREYYRIQGFPEDAIDRLMSAIKSKSVRYKLAGNSIPIGCLKAIFKNIYITPQFLLGF